MNRRHRANSQVHHETVIKGSESGHVLSGPFAEDSISPNNNGIEK